MPACSTWTPSPGWSRPPRPRGVASPLRAAPPRRLSAMSTLSPSGGRRRRRGRAFSVLLVGIAALVIGAAVGWSLTNHGDDPTTTTPRPAPGCPSPQVSTSGSPGASPSTSAKPPASPKPLPSPSSITVDVFNATDRQGLAKTTAKQLGQRGFVIGDVANDPLKDKITGTAVVRYGPKGKNQAKVVAAQVPDSKLVNDKRTDKTVSLALGEAYTNARHPGAGPPRPVALGHLRRPADRARFDPEPSGEVEGGAAAALVLEVAQHRQTRSPGRPCRSSPRWPPGAPRPTTRPRRRERARPRWRESAAGSARPSPPRTAGPTGRR